jgi:hypothetical protein
MVNGRRPFNPDASNSIEALSQLMTLQKSGQVVPPRQLRASVPAAAEAIVMRGLSFEPAARLTDARQFGDSLAHALLAAGEPIPSAVTLRPIVVNPAGTTRPVPPGPVVSPSAPQRRGWRTVLALTIAAAAVLGLGYLATTWSSPGLPAALHQEPAPERSQAEVRTLTYSLTLQQNPSRFPGRKPIQLAEGRVFSAGDRVRLTFTSPQGGHLYVFNESPPLLNGPRSVNILFPSPTSNDGSAVLAGGGTVTIPGSGEFVFDREEGVESLWIIWSRDAQPRLDRMNRWANSRDRGEIKDEADLDALDAFVRDHASPAPHASVDESGGRTTLSAPANVFVGRLDLVHR